MKEKVVPMIVAHMKGIDRQIKEEVMPQIEIQMQEMFVGLIKEQRVMVQKE